MDALEYIHSVRQRYLDLFRQSIRERRDAGVECQPEVWIQPNPGPDGKPVNELFCADILTNANGERGMVMVSPELQDEGPLVGSLRVGNVEVRVFTMAWDVCIVWFRHAWANVDGLDNWRARWMDPDRGSNPDDPDGFCGSAHYLTKPMPEGGGYYCELDLGSAPVEALLELLHCLGKAGATDIELGRSDGSDLDPEVVTILERSELSRESLDQVMLRLLGEIDGVESVKLLEPGEIELHIKDRQSTPKLYTDNLYLRLMRVGVEARVKEVWRFVRGQKESMHDSGPPDLSQLRPVIKNDAFLANLPNFTERGIAVISRRLVADLWVLCVWDEPNGMRFALTDEPAQYGLTEEQFHERALKNYLDQVGEVELADDPPLIVARTGDCYDATLLLHDAFWAETSAKVAGDLLVCVPARDIVLITGTDTKGAIGAMQRAAARVSAGGDHLVSETILIRTDNRWQRFASNFVIDSPSPRPPPNPPRSFARPRREKPWWRFW